MAHVIKYFNAYCSMGLKPIPLMQNSKKPYAKRWSKYWNEQESRNMICTMPDSNLGLLLGDIIDVESDTEEAENLLNKLIGNHSHPFYQSVRGKHHIFKSPDKKLRLLKYKGIEFRGRGHMSVVPPSSFGKYHYQWIQKITSKIPEMPKELMRLYKFVKLGKSLYIKPGHIKIKCSICNEDCLLHKTRYRKEVAVFESQGMKWHCRKCRQFDLRPFCRKHEIRAYRTNR